MIKERLVEVKYYVWQSVYKIFFKKKRKLSYFLHTIEQRQFLILYKFNYDFHFKSKK